MDIIAVQTQNHKVPQPCFTSSDDSRSLPNVLDIPTAFSCDLLSEHPLRTSFHELVYQRTQIGQDKATDVKAEELGCVPNAQLQTDMCRRGVLEPGILNLARDLI